VKRLSNISLNKAIVGDIMRPEIKVHESGITKVWEWITENWILIGFMMALFFVGMVMQHG